jgi:exonuclease SbcC
VRSLLESTEKELALETARQLTDETQEALQEQIVSHEQQITALNQEIGGIIQKMAENNRLEAQNKKLAMEMEAQKKESARWEKLSSMIGSADGKKFSRFAQGLTLVRLTELANRHLLKLSDRYRIIKTSDEDLELKILDTYQADVIRPVTTLSGGESFLVSLALALGLSDLAGKKTQINSLFIDEGFGTLDADTLEVAISALESLQAAGKTICIISHVEALKEGIGVQIRLQKQPGGFSKISLFSYGEEVVLSDLSSPL